jgi:predicted permease
MQQLNIILNQIIVLILLAIIGFVSGRKNYLPENVGKYISSLVIRITAPSLIIASMAAYDFTPETLRDGLWVSMYAFIFIFLSFLLGSLAARLLRLDGSQSNIFKSHVMFGNVGYLALPLLKSIFNEKAVVYAVFFIIVHDTILWTFGVFLMNRHKGGVWKENLGKMLNANTISFALGLIIAFIDLQKYVRAYPAVKAVYNVLYNTLNPLGNTTLYLMMIFIGITLSESKLGGFKGILKKYPTFALLFIKQILMPGLALAVFLLLGGLGSPFVRVIVVLELSMPCAMIVPALAMQFGSDYRLATDNVIFTTVMSIVILPLSIFMLSITGIL